MDELRHAQRPPRPARRDDALAAEIVARVTEVLGPVAWTWEPAEQDTVHVTVHAIAPDARRPYYTLYTTGGSTRPMPGGRGAPPYAEWTACVSPTWFGGQPPGAGLRHRRRWPLELLAELAAYPHVHETPLGPMHSVSNDAPARPYAASTRHCHALVIAPVLWPDELRRIAVAGGREVTFLAPVTILDSELKLKAELGAGELWHDLRSNGVTEMVDPERRMTIQERTGDVDRDARSVWAARAGVAAEAAYRFSSFPDAPVALCARAVGTYSDVAQSPTAGEIVGLPHARTLVAAGAHAILRELWTFKHDDEIARRALQASWGSGEPRVEPGRSTTAAVNEALFASLGFATDVRAERPRLRWMSAVELRGRSAGEVRVAETFDDDATPVPGGLHCPAIFGALDDALARRTRLGHIELAAPVVHPWFAEVVADIAGVAVDRLALTPVEALRSALAGFATDGHVPPPSLLIDVLPVSPPATRPMVKLADGRWATSDLNDLYCDIIDANAAVRAARDDAARATARAELQVAVDALVRNGELGTWRTIEDRPLVSLRELIAQWLRKTWHRVDFSASGPCEISDEQDDRVCAIPEVLARALYAAHPGAGEDLDAVVARAPILVTPTAMSSAVQPIVACEVELCGGGEIWLSEAVADRLGLEPGASVSLHVPITADAIAEARTLLGADRPAPPPPAIDRVAGWLGMAANDGLIDTTRRALASDEPDPVSDLATRLLLGMV